MFSYDGLLYTKTVHMLSKSMHINNNNNSENNNNIDNNNINNNNSYYYTFDYGQRSQFPCHYSRVQSVEHVLQGRMW